MLRGAALLAVVSAASAAQYGSNFFLEQVSSAGTLSPVPASVAGEDNAPCVRISVSDEIFAKYTCAADFASVSKQVYEEGDSTCTMPEGDPTVFTVANIDPVTFQNSFYCQAGAVSYVDMDLYFYSGISVANNLTDCADNDEPFAKGPSFIAVNNCYLDELKENNVTGTPYWTYEEYTCDGNSFTVTKYMDEECTTRTSDEPASFGEACQYLTTVGEGSAFALYGYEEFQACYVGGVLQTPGPTPAPVDASGARRVAAAATAAVLAAGAAVAL